MLRSSLRFTFRLPPEIRELIARLYHRLDAVELRGRPRPDEPQQRGARDAGWARLWSSPTGLYLVVHDERQSKQSNVVEAQIVDHILAAAGDQLLEPIAIVTPHRAQRSLLKLRLMDEASVGVIDTVERLQGGERDTVIVSGTVSDPAAIGTQTEFILDLNRSNVAFSRARRRLIVVCAETLLDYIPVEVEDYESAMLWKALRSLCCRLVARARVDGHTVRIFTLPAERFASGQ